LKVEELLSRLSSLGVTLVAEDGRLRVNAPRGVLDDNLKADIAASKEALIAALQHRGAAVSASIEPVSRTGPLPMSRFQERLWILQRMDPLSTAYNFATVFRNDAGVTVPQALAALRAVIERHEILRAAFTEVDGIPAMRPLPPDATPVEVRNLDQIGATERTARIRADAEAEVRKPFDLAGAPPVRFVIYSDASGAIATLLCAHHIALDAWSVTLLAHEVGAGGTPVCAQGAGLQYADYAAWQHSALDPLSAGPELQWWDRYLAGAPQLSVFPPDLLEGQDAAGATLTVVWDARLAADLRALVRGEGATVYMALLAACATALRWHTGQEDFVLGSPQGIRERTELEKIIGPFVNLLLLRVDATGNPTFRELLRRTRDTMLAAHEHRHVPFETLLERLKPARNLRHSPLFQIALVQHNAPEQTPESMSVSGGAMHELTWFVRETSQGLECTFEYRADLYSAALIERIAAHLQTILRRAVEDGDRRLGELPTLTVPEQEALDRFNATRREYPRTLFIAEFERRAAADPDRLALSYEGETLTYGDLNARANRLAHLLRACGVARGVLVALCVERSESLLVALLAVQKAGGTYLPLDPGFPAERLRFMLEDSGCAVLVTSGALADELELQPRIRVIDLAGAAEVQSQPVGNLPLENGLDDIAYLIYTSGSTGTPKGVRVPHSALTNFLWAMLHEPGIASSDVLAAVTTVSFDIAGLELYLPLLGGARIELIPREIASDGPALAAVLEDRGVTVLQATPSTWRLLIEAGWPGSRNFRAFCGGEALPGELVAALLERCGELWNLYGPTETTIWSCAERVTSDELVTIGRPIANTRIYIVGRAGELLPLGAPGEIYIGGDGVASGYHARPDLTAERFITASFAVGDRVYRTGDLGRWLPDGRLEHLGRLDHQVKIRGFRIELGEIESALAALPAVRQAVVVAREVGPSDRRLVAYIAWQAGEDMTVSEVRRHLRGKLPDYMIPALVVTLEAVPLTPNGKIDRAALPDPFREATLPAAQHEPPVSEMERLLAAVWTEVLKIERVGVHDNFFELGGHSLLSLRVATAVHARCGWRMDPRMLFFQTLGQIAAAGTAVREQVRRLA
jgi:amino acid adenylation domain-containing protein